MPRSRRRPIRKRRFVDPEPAREAGLEELVDDGLLLAVAGVRMTVRNLMIVRALRDGADFDEEWYVHAVTHEFRALASEKRDDAARVADYKSAAADRPGHAMHHSDYRQDDARALERRAAALTELAVRLDAQGEDEATATALVRAARDAALDDIADSIRPSDSVGRPSDQYRRARAERMALVAQDLALLQLQDPKL